MKNERRVMAAMVVMVFCMGIMWGYGWAQQDYEKEQEPSNEGA